MAAHSSSPPFNAEPPPGFPEIATVETRSSVLTTTWCSVAELRTDDRIFICRCRNEVSSFRRSPGAARRGQPAPAGSVEPIANGLAIAQVRAEAQHVSVDIFNLAFA